MSAPQAPLVPDVGVVALVPDEWTTVWQPRHHVLSRLARYFRVAWVEPHLSLREWWLERGGDRPPPVANLSVHRSSPWLPKVYRPAGMGRLTERLRLASARRALERRGATRIALYLWRPAFAAALRAVAHDLSCYHVDDEYTFSDTEREIDPVEAWLLREAGQVFIHSPALLEKKGALNPSTIWVPNGVDWAAYATPVAEPHDLAPIGRPRIGYTGHVKRQLDWPLLEALVERHPHWQFVFVGPCDRAPETAAAVGRLAARPNAHFLGGKTVWKLAEYPQHFDVCLMPYRADAYTKFIYPMKLHEYLAGGRPSVGAEIRSLESFRAVVAIARELDGWSEAIEQALRPEASSPERVEQRRATARDYDWNVLVHRIASAIARRLEIDPSRLGAPP